VPGVPTGLTAAATSTTTATITWTAPADDGGSAITGYVVEESVNGSAYAERNRPSATPTEVEFTGLTPGATYQYRIAAINAEGTGAFSSPSDPLTMPTTDVTVPGQVSGFTKGRFTKLGTQYRVTVRWQPPADDGGAPVTGYVARIGTGGRWSSWADLSNAATRLTELRRDTNYRLQVKAVNSEGVGALAVYRFTTPVR
jgi:titin